MRIGLASLVNSGDKVQIMDMLDVYIIPLKPKGLRKIAITVFAYSETSTYI